MRLMKRLLLAVGTVAAVTSATLVVATRPVGGEAEGSDYTVTTQFTIPDGEPPRPPARYTVNPNFSLTGDPNAPTIVWSPKTASTNVTEDVARHTQIMILSYSAASPVEGLVECLHNDNHWYYTIGSEAVPCESPKAAFQCPPIGTATLSWVTFSGYSENISDGSNRQDISPVSFHCPW